MNRKFILIIAMISLLVSCNGWLFRGIFSGPGKIETPIFDSIPVNFSDLNSEYDDYNSAYPPGLWGFDKEISFSTNRLSEGGNFDFISYFVSIWYNYNEETLYEIRVSPVHESYFRLSFNWINSEFDELGPYYWKVIYPPGNRQRLYSFMYSDNSSGNDDIKCKVFDRYQSPTNGEWNNTISEVNGLERINTEFNESYPSIRENELYFTSDRSGDYDIYLGYILNDNVLETFNIGLSDEVTLLNRLSGPADDKCPFVLGDIMVYTSNRESGYGGFDLYYSILSYDGWSSPINFGEDINTEFDEYRPIIIPTDDHSGNNLMIFSSNRPGGKGGFDLYYVGVSKSF